MRKSCLPTGFEPAAFELPVHCSLDLLSLLLDYRSEQWTGNPKAAGLNPVEDNLFALLVLSSSRSGGSSVGFRAGSLQARSTQND